MDRFERTADIIKKYYAYKENGDNAEFVKGVCDYFDSIKTEEILGADLNFFSLLANEAGVPQYYDMLISKNNIDEDGTIQDISLGMLGALFYDASLTVEDGSGKLHRFQRMILDKYNYCMRNRFVLTAPTSFGKTFIVYQIMNKMKYNNILLIFPTISLLTENYERIRSNNTFRNYRIHTLSECEFSPEECNIFLFTPERYLSFLDANKSLKLDFSFIDEVYKIDNGYLIDETIAENERDIAYRLALEYVCKNSKDILLAGPYISIASETDNNSFLTFCNRNGFSVLFFNEYEIVSRNYYEITKTGNYDIEDLHISIPNIGKKALIKNIVLAVSNPQENTIIYCGKKIDAEKYSTYLIDEPDAVKTIMQMYTGYRDDIYELFLNHLEMTYGSDWIVVKALRNRVGIHHGLIPKYIQKEIINLFNRGQLLCMFSTTTITEGVNTPAKNIVITSLKKGKKELKQFDAKNIAGRAGRFGKHYSGRVIDISKGFEDIVEGNNDDLKHKNYDPEMPKTDVDFQITEEQYLSENEREKKAEIERKLNDLNLPSEVVNKFKVVGPEKKIWLYETIINMSSEDRYWINELIRKVYNSRGGYFDWQGLQVVINLIAPIISDAKLLSMINRKISTKNGDEFSLLVCYLNAYLQQGFMGMVNYKIDKKGVRIDTAMRNIADIVYNTFKYQLVKYLGVFDIIYRYVVAKEKQSEIDKVIGLSYLLQKLEYNATNEKAKLVSDYGVPFNIVRKYDNPGVNVELDKYEQHIDMLVKELIE